MVIKSNSGIKEEALDTCTARYLGRSRIRITVVQEVEAEMEAVEEDYS